MEARAHFFVKKYFIKNNFHAIKKKHEVPPLPRRGRGGTPIPGRRPGIKSTPKIEIATKKKRE
jgi:hypothetical protein